MTVACPTCDRAWDATAAFCGACGERLDTGVLRATRPPPSAGGERRTSHPMLWGLLGLALVATVAVTVPVVTIGRDATVSGEVGVPDTERMPTGAPGPRGLQAPPTPAPAPTVQCHDAQGEVLDCLQWVQDGGSGATEATDGGFGATVHRGVALSYAGRTVTAVDVATGAVRWTRAFPDPLHMATVEGDALLVAVGERAMLLSVATGEQRWDAPTSEGLYGDILTEDLALTLRQPSSSASTVLVARERGDGAVRWTWPVRSSEPLQVTDRGPLLVSQPETQTVTAVAAETGQELWQRPGTVRPGAGPDGIAVLYEPVTPTEQPPDRSDLHVTVVDEGEGAVIWERTIRESVAFVDETRLMVVTSDRRLRAHDVRTGALVWEARTDERETPAHESVWHTGADPPGILVTTTPRGVLQGRDLRDGRVRWQRPVTIGGDSYAAVDGHVVQVRSGPATQLRDVRTGDLLLSYRAEGSLIDVDLDAGLYLMPRAGRLLQLAVPGP